MTSVSMTSVVLTQGFWRPLGRTVWEPNTNRYLIFTLKSNETWKSSWIPVKWYEGSLETLRVHCFISHKINVSLYLFSFPDSQLAAQTLLSLIFSKKKTLRYFLVLVRSDNTNMKLLVLAYCTFAFHCFSPILIQPKSIWANKMIFTSSSVTSFQNDTAWGKSIENASLAADIYLLGSMLTFPRFVLRLLT